MVKTGDLRYDGGRNGSGPTAERNLGKGPDAARPARAVSGSRRVGCAENLDAYGEPQGNDHFRDGSPLPTATCRPESFDARNAGTTPGSFARPVQIRAGRAGALTFSSPDTPGMPGPSEKTAWDFMPADWQLRPGFETDHEQAAAWQPPADFVPQTQLDFARLGVVTPQMQRVAEREGHLTAEQVRDEVAAGRMVIPANRVHLGYQLDPMCIGRASKTKINANMGASPVSSSTDEEVEKLRWAERWGADTVMDLSTGGDLDACRDAILRHSTVPIGTVPIYSMIIGRQIEELSLRIDSRHARSIRPGRGSIISRSMPACCASICRWCGGG